MIDRGSLPRRVLVVLPETGYFRMYGSTIVELGRRGCEVLLAFERPDKRAPASQVPAGSGASVTSLGELPGGSSPAATTLRLGLDYVRYLEAAFADATYLRRRAEKHLPPRLAFLTRCPPLPRWLVSAAIAVGRAIERLLPADGALVDFIRRAAPDVVFVSPVVALGASGVRQTELVKAARAARVPVVVGVASWDHLTSKGLLRVVPDVVTVWNDVQRHEAVTLHRIPPERVVITGAQSLDHWFDPAAADGRQLLERAGLTGDGPLLLYVGSSRNMAPGDSELRFVRRWLAALRASPDGLLRTVKVLVRPHPTNTAAWRDADLADPAAAVHPREYSGIPLSASEVETFRQSLLLSAAVVGINTTAMIEGAIFGRPVLTVRDREFTHSQEQTVHFGYLSDAASGCALTAGSLEEHVQQLAAVLRDPAPQRAAGTRFVRDFIRPHGLDTPAVTWLCDAVERLAGRPSGAHALNRAVMATDA